MWRFTELTYFLSSLYYRQDDIFSILQRAGLKPQHIHQSTNSVVFWTNIIHYAEQRGQITDLLKVIVSDGHDRNEYLLSMIDNLNTSFKSPYQVGVNTDDFRITSKQLELITNGKKTFLPISFLSEGIKISNSVARVVTHESLGTGFVINGEYLLTNNHVIDSIDTASKTKIQFNYQLNSHGALQQIKEYRLEPNSDFGFLTSEENDWTVVKIKDYQNEFGSIVLKPVTTSINDFVNIIQHPGGEHKQIALYHNLVVSIENDRVRYLTDTLPGSSGSPVFDSNWEIVALHHKGGKGSSNGRDLLYNQGINVNTIIRELRNRKFPLAS